jgi:outer membrane translocation and assembly module TamA
MTLAVRVGGAHTFGTFPFYASNGLGGATNLRGYRETRFSGRSSLYTNSEVRVGLITVRGDVLPGTIGAVGFFDAGRVWTDGESSSLWHTGYGGGVWFDLVGELLLRVTAGRSSEDTTFLFGAGFFF